MSNINVKDLDRAEAMLEANDYASARAIVEDALKVPTQLQPSTDEPQKADLPVLSRAALIKGKALLGPVVDQFTDQEQGDPSAEMFRPGYKMLKLALHLDKENKEAQLRLEYVEYVVAELHKSEQRRTEKQAAEQAAKLRKRNHPHPLDVVIVGAGAAGVGVGVLLTKLFGLSSERVVLVERGEDVGETFRQWPKEMRFISPSFNQQGWTRSFDLNSIVYGTSPAFTVFSEHPTGEQYADYLHHIATSAALNVRTKTEVKGVRPLRGEEGEGFGVIVAPAASAEGGDSASAAQHEILRCRYVIWAAGEFQYPRSSASSAFPGSELCLHNSSVRSWAQLPGDDFVIIGGYESGMDAAYNLSMHGKRCAVVSSTAYWNVATDDPSTELAPYTAERVRTACNSATPPRLLAPLRVHAVEKETDGSFAVHAREVPETGDDDDDDEGGAKKKLGQHRVPLQVAAEDISALPSGVSGLITLRTSHPPLLCSGFEGSVRLGVAKDLFQWGGDGNGGAPFAHPLLEKKEARTLASVAMEEDEETQEDQETEKDREEADGGAEAASRSGCADSSPLLNDVDESTKTPGLFLVGPAVRHKELSFCFVYKFRQRFGVVANAIAEGLGFQTKNAVAKCRDMEMFLDDFSCCKGACGESC